MIMTLSELSTYHSKAVLIAFATTGLASHHQPIEIALEIIQLPTGEQVNAYDSLVKVSKGVWEGADPKAQAIHGITWREIERLGQDPSVISEQIGTLFKVSRIFEERVCFLCFGEIFHATFLRKLFNGVIQVPTTPLNTYLLQRNIGLARKLSFSEVELDISFEEFAYLGDPGEELEFFDHNEEFPVIVRYPLKRVDYLRRMGIRPKTECYRPLDVIAEMRQAMEKRRFAEGLSSSRAVSQ